MFLVVHLQAKKRGIVGLPKSELPPIWALLPQGAAAAHPPIAILVVVLALRFSPQYAILLSLAALVVVCIPIREQRITVRKLFTGLAHDGQDPGADRAPPAPRRGSWSVSCP